MSRKNRWPSRANDDAYRICRCGPSCYKMLSKHARDRHYASANVTELLPSASELGSSSDQEDIDSEPEHDREPRKHCWETKDECGTEETDGDDSGGDDDEPVSADEFDIEDPIAFKFNEREEAEADPNLLYLSTKEIEAELKALLGPAREQEMHTLSKCTSVYVTRTLT